MIFKSSSDDLPANGMVQGWKDVILSHSIHGLLPEVTCKN